MEPLIKFWLFLCHWIEFDTFESEEDLDGTVETLTPLRQERRPGLRPLLHRLAAVLSRRGKPLPERKKSA